jgi:hypothetical protein
MEKSVKTMDDLIDSGIKTFSGKRYFFIRAFYNQQALLEKI